MPLLREFSPDSRHTRYTVFLCKGCFSNGCVGRITSFGDGLRSMGGSTSIVIRTEYQVCVGHWHHNHSSCFVLLDLLQYSEYATKWREAIKTKIMAPGSGL